MKEGEAIDFGRNPFTKEKRKGDGVIVERV
jgi:hypothetical protein